MMRFSLDILNRLLRIVSWNENNSQRSNEHLTCLLKRRCRNGYCDDARLGIRDKNMDFIYNLVDNSLDK